MIFKNYPKPQQTVLCSFESEEFFFQAVVEQIKDDGRLVIKQLAGNKLEDSFLNQPIILEYQIQDELCHFVSTVEFLRQDDDHQILLAPCPNPQRVQRRRFFRLKKCLFFRLLPAITLPDNYQQDKSVQKKLHATWLSKPKNDFIELQTFNISGTGLGVLSPIELAKGETCFIDLDQDEWQLQVVARVMTSQPAKNSFFQVGLDFIGLTQLKQDKLVETIFKHQYKK